MSGLNPHADLLEPVLHLLSFPKNEKNPSTNRCVACCGVVIVAGVSLLLPIVIRQRREIYEYNLNEKEKKENETNVDLQYFQ